jgi:hypothetical protein
MLPLNQSPARFLDDPAARMSCNAMLAAYRDAGQPCRGLTILMIMMQCGTASVHPIKWCRYLVHTILGGSSVLLQSPLSTTPPFQQMSC